MSKYSFELKKEIVKAYLRGEGGYKYLARKYEITSKVVIERWVKAYKKLGEEGLLGSRQNKKYSFEFKLDVVELYLTTEISYQELALSVGINNPSLITKWVNDFRIAGPDALKPKRKGRRKQVNNPNDTKFNTQAINKDDKEYLKQLEDENLKLRIENAYLKELRRLRLEEGALLKKQRELFTASEDSSN